MTDQPADRAAGQPASQPAGRPASRTEISSSLLESHPLWPIKFCYKNHMFFDTDSGELTIVSANLPPTYFCYKNHCDFAPNLKNTSKCKRNIVLNSGKQAIDPGDSLEISLELSSSPRAALHKAILRDSLPALLCSLSMIGNCPCLVPNFF